MASPLLATIAVPAGLRPRKQPLMVVLLVKIERISREVKPLITRLRISLPLAFEPLTDSPQQNAPAAEISTRFDATPLLPPSIVTASVISGRRALVTVMVFDHARNRECVRSGVIIRVSDGLTERTEPNGWYITESHGAGGTHRQANKQRGKNEVHASILSRAGPTGNTKSPTVTQVIV
jgi:hypothetical protein